MSSRAGAGRLGRFCGRIHGCFKRRADALFELCDSILATGSVSSPIHLSLPPFRRRGWGNLYAALSRGEIDAEALRELLGSYDPGTNSTPVYAVDVSPWPSEASDAESSPGRVYLYNLSRHSSGRPIVAGWAYQLGTGIAVGSSAKFGA